jgi:flagellar basal-body rod protein FlgF
METTSLIALSSQAALRRHMDVIAHNIANANSTGFKGQKMMFTEHMVKSKGADSFIPAKLAFVRDIATFRDTSEGPMTSTGNPLDIALKGDGYFAVRTPEGERYTRNGHFRLDAGGQLVTEEGHSVLSAGGAPVFFAPEDTQITIARDGSISTENGQLGRLMVARFDNDADLQATPGGLYDAGDQAPLAVDQPDVVQGMLERSNIEPIIELTRMIDVHRAYDNVRKLIEREDERMAKVAKTMLAGGQA